MHFQFSLILLCAVVAVVTALIALLLGPAVGGLDLKFLKWFSRITQSPKWFVLWVLVLLGWVPLRELLRSTAGWYTDNVDLVVITVLWSVFPFMVENALKYSSAEQMALLQEQNRKLSRQSQQIITLTNALQQQMEDTRDMGEATHALVKRLLALLEEPEDEATV